MWLNYLNRALQTLLILGFSQTLAFSSAYPKIWNVPPPNHYFVGREDVLESILAMFKSTDHNTTVIAGPQGFGKTQIAKRFVYKNFADYDVIWWFRASQYLKPQFEKFALEIANKLGLNVDKSMQALGPELLIREVKEAIRNKNLKCLIIFDDAQSYPDIEQYVLYSHENNIHTLITTKNGNFSSHALQTRPFKRANSIEYINLFLPNESEKSKDLLANRLDDCPAALAVSVEYIKNYPGMTIDTYLLRHKEQKFSPPATNGASKKLDSPVDEYNTDLLAAIQMNMVELKQNSEVAFQLLGLLSLLHRDEIPISLIENWANEKGLLTDIITLLDLIKQYSLIEVNPPKENKGGSITMHELIQQIVSSLIPASEKKKLIDDATRILITSFSGRSDHNVKTILQDNKPLLNTAKLSHEADVISHQTAELTSLRIRALDVLVGMIRDFPMARKIISHLENDLQKQTPRSKDDEALYLANMALYYGLDSPDYDKAIPLGLQALKLTEADDNLIEERLRIISNLVQHHALTGRSDEGQNYVEMGEKIFHLSKSDPYSALFILAKNILHLDRGELQKIIDVIGQNQDLLDRQTFYPSMRYFILNQLGEALLKKGEIEEAIKVLATAEKFAVAFHGEDDQNTFFGKLYLLKAMCLFNNPKDFEEAKSLLEKGVNILEECYHGTDKHRNQAFAHLQLGKLLHQHQKFDQAKVHYLKSEAIFDKIFKSKKVDDISDLYKQLTLLGVDTKDEALTTTYLKKHTSTFGLDHFRTKEIMLYLDEKEVVLPI